MHDSNDFTLKKLTGDASGRSYYRLTFEDENSVPKNLIMMKKEPYSEDTDDFLLLRDFLEECGVTVPAVYFTNPDEGLIYLEDCGDTLLEDTVADGNREKIMEHYPRALDTLVTMQVEGTKRIDSSAPAANRSFDMEKLMYEMNFTTYWFIEGLNKKKLTQNEKEKLETAFQNLVRPIAKEPTVFTHRDYHARNIMIKNGRYFVLDFQDARMGPLQYDLASLMFDSYVKLDDADRDDLLDYYLGRLKFKSRETAQSKDFLDMLYRVALQRNLKALGTFGFQAVSQKNETYLKYIPATVSYIRSNISKINGLEKDTDLILSLLA